ncbi:MAG TPA: transporter [Vicinamibacteria bacterium]|nr:transporter [Vicinamibacteria bacterium]
MRPLTFGFIAVSTLSLEASAQELEPGAYSVSPAGVNIVVVTNNFSGGDVAFDPTLPIEEARSRINTTVFAYVRSLNLLGRSGNVGIVAPYSIGHLEGLYLGQFTEVDRSGFRDPIVRFAVNLVGAPAMSLKEFATYRQKTNIGVSLVAVMPLGEYDTSKLINLGSNRWSFKPEVGLSQAVGRWTFELYAGVWLFTDNKSFFGAKLREQDPIGSAQIHVLRTFKPRLWAAFDANFYAGGRTTVDGRLNLDLQRNSRVGGTLSLPLNPRQSLKFSYSRGAYTTIGADFHALVAAYQYLWGAGL